MLWTAFGPVFSSHVWSTICAAMNWPKNRLILGGNRWIMFGKNPSMFEKWWVLRRGVCVNCLPVRLASSKAIKSPRRVTSRAASFKRGGIVMTQVFGSTIFDVIRSPAKMLPQASRLMGLITAGLFSLIGEIELNRGCPIETKNTTRRL